MIILTIFLAITFACSDFQLKSNDGSVVCGRGMDFSIPLDSQIIVFNRETFFNSTAPDGSQGFKWKSKYGFIGINAFGAMWVDEGMNEHGLTCGYLELDETRYPSVNKSDYNRSMAVTDLCMWLLGNFKTTDEVVSDYYNIKVWGNKIPVLNIEMGLHIPIHDANGHNLVIEFLDGEVALYENILGILTNDPSLFYQWNNLGRYNSLTPNETDVIINGDIIRPNGDGLQGLPGSFSSADRFVRIATLIRYLEGLNTASDAVIVAANILNSVNIIKGISRDVDKGKTTFETTHWTTIKDLTNKIFYYRNGDGVLRAIYLNKINFNPSIDHSSLVIKDSKPFVLDMTPNI